ncbi:YLP motif-containing protein 1 [Bombina bombina]|uniref:YLP motif-containing protein 1 n=1 Tax=Bombina bombina TaxID=8345 RepID=UPI00235B03BF|nr:YLP motif-containing protein 1 [Bombina bombina]XP_053553166.1 YLP motif-containing protein 1 [Bombina bombina]
MYSGWGRYGPAAPSSFPPAAPPPPPAAFTSFREQHMAQLEQLQRMHQKQLESVLTPGAPPPPGPPPPACPPPPAGYGDWGNSSGRGYYGPRQPYLYPPPTYPPTIPPPGFPSYPPPSESNLPPPAPGQPPPDTSYPPPSESNLPPPAPGQPPPDTSYPPPSESNLPPPDTSYPPPSESNLLPPAPGQPPPDTSYPPPSESNLPPPDTSYPPPSESNLLPPAPGQPPPDTSYPPLFESNLPPPHTLPEETAPPLSLGAVPPPVPLLEPSLPEPIQPPPPEPIQPPPPEPVQPPPPEPIQPPPPEHSQPLPPEPNQPPLPPDYIQLQTDPSGNPSEPLMTLEQQQQYWYKQHLLSLQRKAKLQNNLSGSALQVQQYQGGTAPDGSAPPLPPTDEAPPPPPSDESNINLSEDPEQEQRLKTLQAAAAHWQQYEHHRLGFQYQGIIQKHATLQQLLQRYQQITQQAPHVAALTIDLQLQHYEMQQKQFLALHQEWETQYKKWVELLQTYPHKDQLQEYQAQWNSWQGQMKATKSYLKERVSSLKSLQQQYGGSQYVSAMPMIPTYSSYPPVMPPAVPPAVGIPPVFTGAAPPMVTPPPLPPVPATSYSEGPPPPMPPLPSAPYSDAQPPLPPVTASSNSEPLPPLPPVTAVSDSKAQLPLPHESVGEAKDASETEPTGGPAPSEPAAVSLPQPPTSSYTMSHDVPVSASDTKPWFPSDEPSCTPPHQQFDAGPRFLPRGAVPRFPSQSMWGPGPRGFQGPRPVLQEKNSDERPGIFSSGTQANLVLTDPEKNNLLSSSELSQVPETSIKDLKSQKAEQPIEKSMFSKGQALGTGVKDHNIARVDYQSVPTEVPSRGHPASGGAWERGFNITKESVKFEQSNFDSSKVDKPSEAKWGERHELSGNQWERVENKKGLQDDHWNTTGQMHKYHSVNTDSPSGDMFHRWGGPKEDRWGGAEGAQKERWGGTEGALEGTWGRPEEVQQDSRDRPEGVQQDRWGHPEAVQQDSLGRPEGVQQDRCGLPEPEGVQQDRYGLPEGVQQDRWGRPEGVQQDRWGRPEGVQQDRWGRPEGVQQDRWGRPEGVQQDRWGRPEGVQQDRWGHPEGVQQDRWGRPEGVQQDRWGRPEGVQQDRWERPEGVQQDRCGRPEGVQQDRWGRPEGVQQDRWGRPEGVQQDKCGHPEGVQQDKCGRPEGVQQDRWGRPEGVQQDRWGRPEGVQQDRWGRPEGVQQDRWGRPEGVQQDRIASSDYSNVDMKECPDGAPIDREDCTEGSLDRQGFPLGRMGGPEGPPHKRLGRPEGLQSGTWDMPESLSIEKQGVNEDPMRQWQGSPEDRQGRPDRQEDHTGNWHGGDEVIPDDMSGKPEDDFGNRWGSSEGGGGDWGNRPEDPSANWRGGPRGRPGHWSIRPQGPPGNWRGGPMEAPGVRRGMPIGPPGSWRGGHMRGRGGPLSVPGDGRGGYLATPGERRGGLLGAPGDRRGGLLAAPAERRGGLLAAPAERRGGLLAAPAERRGGLLAAPAERRGGLLAAPVERRGGLLAAPAERRGGLLAAPGERLGGPIAGPSDRLTGPLQEVDKAMLQNRQAESVMGRNDNAPYAEDRLHQIMPGSQSDPEKDVAKPIEEAKGPITGSYQSKFRKPYQKPLETKHSTPTNQQTTTESLTGQIALSKAGEASSQGPKKPDDSSSQEQVRNKIQGPSKMGVDVGKASDTSVPEHTKLVSSGSGPIGFPKTSASESPGLAKTVTMGKSGITKTSDSNTPGSAKTVDSVSAPPTLEPTKTAAPQNTETTKAAVAPTTEPDQPLASGPAKPAVAPTKEPGQPLASGPAKPAAPSVPGSAKKAPIPDPGLVKTPAASVPSPAKVAASGATETAKSVGQAPSKADSYMVTKMEVSELGNTTSASNVQKFQGHRLGDENIVQRPHSGGEPNIQSMVKNAGPVFQGAVRGGGNVGWSPARGRGPTGLTPRPFHAPQDKPLIIPEANHGFIRPQQGQSRLNMPIHQGPLEVREHGGPGLTGSAGHVNFPDQGAGRFNVHPNKATLGVKEHVGPGLSECAEIGYPEQLSSQGGIPEIYDGPFDKRGRGRSRGLGRGRIPGRPGNPDVENLPDRGFPQMANFIEEKRPFVQGPDATSPYGREGLHRDSRFVEDERFPSELPADHRMREIPLERERVDGWGRDRYEGWERDRYEPWEKERNEAWDRERNEDWGRDRNWERDRDEGWDRDMHWKESASHFPREPLDAFSRDDGHYPRDLDVRPDPWWDKLPEKDMDRGPGSTFERFERPHDVYERNVRDYPRLPDDLRFPPRDIDGLPLRRPLSPRPLSPFRPRSPIPPPIDRYMQERWREDREGIAERSFHERGELRIREYPERPNLWQDENRRDLELERAEWRPLEDRWYPEDQERLVDNRLNPLPSLPGSLSTVHPSLVDKDGRLESDPTSNSSTMALSQRQHEIILKAAQELKMLREQKEQLNSLKQFFSESQDSDDSKQTASAQEADPLKSDVYQVHSDEAVSGRLAEGATTPSSKSDPAAPTTRLSQRWDGDYDDFNEDTFSGLWDEDRKTQKAEGLSDQGQRGNFSLGSQQSVDYGHGREISVGKVEQVPYGERVVLPEPVLERGPSSFLKGERYERDHRDRDSYFERQSNKSVDRREYDRERDRDRNSYRDRGHSDSERERNDRERHARDERLGSYRDSKDSSSRRSGSDKSYDRKLERPGFEPPPAAFGGEQRRGYPEEKPPLHPSMPGPRAEKKPEMKNVDDVLKKPGRESRPDRIVVIMRGLPGSGKTHVAKLIRDKEVECGGAAPRVLSLDDYFITEVERVEKDPDSGKKVKKKVLEYEYEPEMEETYRSSMFKTFKKTLDDGFFPFIILDCINDRVRHFEQFWSAAKTKGFEVYLAEMSVDSQTCAKRNVHGRKVKEISKMADQWESAPRHMMRLDVRSLLQDAAIEEVEMEDSEPSAEPPKDLKNDAPEEEDSERASLSKSKWEMDTSEGKLDKLDGLNTSKRKRDWESVGGCLEDYLQLPDDYDSRESQPGKKRVRWADLEEKKDADRKRAIGFVVGQTDWDKITDKSGQLAERALNRTKYI